MGNLKPVRICKGRVGGRKRSVADMASLELEDLLQSNLSVASNSRLCKFTAFARKRWHPFFDGCTLAKAHERMLS